MASYQIEIAQDLLDIQIPIETTRNGKYFVIYSPVVDVSSYGKTQQEAMDNFVKTVKILLEEYS